MYQPVTTSRRSGCSIALIPLAIVVIVGGIIGFSFLVSSGLQLPGFLNDVAARSRFVKTRVVAVTPGNDADIPDILILNEPPGVRIEDNRGVRYSDVPIYLSYTSSNGNNRSIQWEVEVDRSNNDTPHEINLTTDSSRVYIAIDDRMQAVDRVSGEILWETRLSDLVDDFCVGCIQSVDNYVVVRTTDNVLEGFDSSNGQSLWRVRLQADSPPSTHDGAVALLAVNDLVALVDDVESEDGADKALIFYEAATGDIALQMRPTCPYSSGGYVYGIGYSPVIYHAGRNELYFIFGHPADPPCIQAWDAATGEAIWQERFPEATDLPFFAADGLMTTTSGVTFLTFGNDTLFLAVEHDGNSDTSILAVDLATGQSTILAEELDYTLSPLAVRDNVLAVYAKRTRGSERSEIWGIDTNSGQRLWTYELEAALRYDVDSGSGPEWDARLIADGLVVIQGFAEAGELRVETLDMQDGTVIRQESNKLRETIISLWTWITWTNRHAFFVISGDMYVLDLLTGELDKDWP